MHDFHIEWSPEKNEYLKAERGLCFEDVEVCLRNGHILADTPHPNQEKYPNQHQLHILIDGYVCVVPYVQTGETLFLKTIFRSRKANKYFLNKDETP